MKPRLIAYLQSFRTDTMSPHPPITRHLFGIVNHKREVAGFSLLDATRPGHYADHMKTVIDRGAFILVTVRADLSGFVNLGEDAYRGLPTYTCDIFYSGEVNNYLRTLSRNSDEDTNVLYMSNSDARSALRAVSETYRILYQRTEISEGRHDPADSLEHTGFQGKCYFPPMTQSGIASWVTFGR